MVLTLRESLTALRCWRSPREIIMRTGGLLEPFSCSFREGRRVLVNVGILLRMACITTSHRYDRSMSVIRELDPDLADFNKYCEPRSDPY